MNETGRMNEMWRMNEIGRSGMEPMRSGEGLR